MAEKEDIADKAEATKAKIRSFQALRGFKDYLPPEQVFWSEVMEEAKLLARQYGYQRIDTPILEPLSLFKRSIGEYTDIVSK
jgi:histidyl-tRNA synthetase